MGLLSKLKSLLGAGEETPSRRGDVDVTVEREPTDVAAESERAVKGADVEASAGVETDADSEASTGTEATAGADRSEAGEETVGDDVSAADETADAGEAAETANEEAAEAPTDGPAAESVERIKGIGPSYAARLGEVGMETVGDLAGGDAEALSEETGLSEKRLGRWIERAQARTR